MSSIEAARTPATGPLLHMGLAPAIIAFTAETTIALRCAVLKVKIRRYFEIADRVVAAYS